MEKFAIDLDKVLDEFELNEDDASEVAPGKEIKASGLEDFLKASGETPYSLIPPLEPPEQFHTPVAKLRSNDGPDTRLRYDSPFQTPPDTLDLDDADFGPSPLRPPITLEPAAPDLSTPSQNGVSEIHQFSSQTQSRGPSLSSNLYNNNISTPPISETRTSPYLTGNNGRSLDKSDAAVPVMTLSQQFTPGQLPPEARIINDINSVSTGKLTTGPVAVNEKYTVAISQTPKALNTARPNKAQNANLSSQNKNINHGPEHGYHYTNLNGAPGFPVMGGFNSINSLPGSGVQNQNVLSNEVRNATGLNRNEGQGYGSLDLDTKDKIEVEKMSKNFEQQDSSSTESSVESGFGSPQSTSAAIPRGFGMSEMDLESIKQTKGGEAIDTTYHHHHHHHQEQASEGLSVNNLASIVTQALLGDNENTAIERSEEISSCGPESGQGIWTESNVAVNSCTDNSSSGSPAQHATSLRPQTVEARTKVGFGDLDDIEVTEGDLDALLEDFNMTDENKQLQQNSFPKATDIHTELKQVDKRETWKPVERDSGVSLSRDSGTLAIESEVASVKGSTSYPGGHMPTPMDDPGFGKIPGYVDTHDAIVEEEEDESKAVTETYVQPERLNAAHQAPARVQTVNAIKSQESGLKESTPAPKGENSGQDDQVTMENSTTAALSPVKDLPLSSSSTEAASTSALPSPSKFASIQTVQAFTASSSPSHSAHSPSKVTSDGQQTRSGYSPASPPQSPWSPQEPQVRQKETGQMKRPNSLLGLSTVSLPPPTFSPSAATARSPGQEPQIGGRPRHVDAMENPHDIVNGQIAEQNRQQLKKKQMNLNIKSVQNSNESGMDVHPERGLHDGNNTECSVGDLIDNNTLCDTDTVGVPLVFPGRPNPDWSQTQTQVVPEARSSSPTSAPVQGDGGESVGVTLMGPGHASPSQIPGDTAAVDVQPVYDEDGASAAPPRQKRPTSLNLPPRDVRVRAEDDTVRPHSMDMAQLAEEAGIRPDIVDEIIEPSDDGSFPVVPPVTTQLGKVGPLWIPDSEAATCMNCNSRFTFTRRRHHCRACGKVFCAPCCNLKIKLHYLENKDGRVCRSCYDIINRAQAYEHLHGSRPSPNPNNPRSRRQGEPKSVMFSDGIRPGGDLTELDGSDERLPARRTGRSQKKVAQASTPVPADSDAIATDGPSSSTAVITRPFMNNDQDRNPSLIPEGGLPPVILETGVKGDFSIEENPSSEQLIPRMKDEEADPLVFAVNKNLFVMAKIVNLDCCVNRVCWTFSTKGMCTVGQDEVVIILECLPDEKEVPRDIFCHFQNMYEEAGKGNTVSDLGHTLFNQTFLDSKDHGGFLYIRPSFQCLQKLALPAAPYLFGILLQKWETPWAKVFPIRLMLRLGAEFRYYPCPLISVRFRKPVFGEIGHTIMNLLVDFRNYQYMLPQIKGVTIHMEDKKTFINFPRNRYDDVLKVVNNSNDHVMALAAYFSLEADSHLVCIQNDEGNYQTQAINILNKPRKVTGASFVVFNGALKTSSGLTAKSSIVEDGLMVQITPESMLALKSAMREMKDYTIGCGSITSSQPEEQVITQWVEDDRHVNIGVKSPIDNMPMDGIESIHIHNATDFIGEHRTIRWTEVFFIRNEEAVDARCEPVDLSRLAETLAQACCIALTPHLDKLKDAQLVKLGFRANIDSETVGYEVGSNGEKLPAFYMNDLDNELIPVIHNAASQSREGPVVLELIFHILE
ncbi:zinc finger FYVE domain-containing protein 16 isoform X2 [Lingula anatina]|uniref:Zinc finger FYVE domain-containing protein 16 isoform X2 n=1 Tax=Lingula anatina TaxID=7574 RepID=A0A1S3JNX6_LINAN|nr:zinc finger FYVE domain-containing protein 16 isoform X2 [Lingula anatina]|eukprot:XP_013412068.1 zinc finger FYVE domain-containing protein 16 isoform X2 [Lingula anatina]